MIVSVWTTIPQICQALCRFIQSSLRAELLGSEFRSPCLKLQVVYNVPGIAIDDRDAQLCVACWAAQRHKATDELRQERQPF
eukprot:746301-Amphidinium_carterae.1